jgi:hypothetical protein
MMSLRSRSTATSATFRTSASRAHAASSLAGVSTNYVGQVSANNNNASDAKGAAALVSGNSWASALKDIGNYASYAYGSSYKPKGA